MSATLQRVRAKNQLQSVLIVLAFAALTILTGNFSVLHIASAGEDGNDAVITMPRPQMLDAREHAQSVRYHPTTIWTDPAEPTAALRAAVWAATAVIAVASVAIAAAPDQVHRYRRPASTGSKRWAAGWAGRAGHGRPVAPGLGGLGKATGG